MQQSIIAGMLLRSVSMKSFARAPSSPIFSFTCFSNHSATGAFFRSGGPTEKCIGFGVGTTTVMGGIDGSFVGEALAEESGGIGATGGVGCLADSGILGMRAIVAAILARSSALRLFRTSDLI